MKTASGSSVCATLAPYPLQLFGSIIMEYEDRPMICGGSPATAACHRFNPATNIWESGFNMLNSRHSSSTASLSCNEQWIIGGVLGDSQPTFTSEIFKDGVFRPGPDLPEPMSEGCAVTINSTHIFIGNPSQISIQRTKETILS